MDAQGGSVGSHRRTDRNTPSPSPLLFCRLITQFAWLSPWTVRDASWPPLAVTAQARYACKEPSLVPECRVQYLFLEAHTNTCIGGPATYHKCRAAGMNVTQKDSPEWTWSRSGWVTHCRPRRPRRIARNLPQAPFRHSSLSNFRNIRCWLGSNCRQRFSR
jgi:hypothetical protein